MPNALKPTGLVVEDDEMQRSMICMLLEDEMDVIQCESAEAAVLVLDKVGGCLCLLFTDVNLAGVMTGVDLATIARTRFPGLDVIVASGNARPDLPSGTVFMQKPWNSGELLSEVHKACSHH